ncbi:hypothetical protein I302_102160 [Kwoniella bestiolae CBS 10118]|uniref:DUF7918 domain-containing protein n=1 Tax=Kwoniella bestiolae CBS 10118 TaxID=1296100 RepID=A0AAJ8M594_9TREE
MLSEGTAAGLEAWIEGKDDKKPLNEYQVQHHKAKNGESSYTECFLETTDDPFTINIRKVSGSMEKKQFQAKAYVDGNILESRAWLRYRLSQVWDKVYERDGGDFKRSSLQFSPIPTTDDPTLVTIDPITMSKIGTIEIDLEEGTLVETGVQEARSSQLSSGTVYEKGKKFAYSVSGSDSTVCEIPKVMHYTFVPDSHKKFTHRFIFRYRPRAVLVQMRIIDEPEPSLTPAPRPARKRKLDAIDVDATPEGEDEDVKPDLNAKRVKYLEEQVKHLADQLKRSRNGSKDQDEVVDLTFDDDDD